MPFTKISSNEMDGGGFASDLDGTAHWEEILRDKLLKAQTEYSSAIAELEAGATEEERRAQLVKDQENIVAAKDIEKSASDALATALSTFNDKRDGRARLIAIADECEDEVLVCHTALSKVHGGSGPPPELSPAEIEWLSAFSIASSTPPSETMTLQTALQRAMLDSNQADKALRRYDLELTSLSEELVKKTTAQNSAENRIADLVHTLRSRRASNDWINTLANAVKFATAQLEGTAEAAVSMAAVMVPFRRLALQLDAELAALPSEPGSDSEFKKAVAVAQSTFDGLRPKIGELEPLSGAAAQARLSELDALGLGLNALVDQLEILRSETLIVSRMATLQSNSAEQLTTFSEPFKYKGEFLPPRLPKLANKIKTLDVSDWPASQIQAQDLVNKFCDSLETANTAKIATVALKAAKTLIYENHLPALQDAVKANQIASRRVYNFRVQKDDDTCDLPTFNAALADLKRIYETDNQRIALARQRQENINAGLFLGTSEWRTALGAPSSSYTLSHKQRGTFNDRAWEVHLTISSTSVLDGTDHILMTGANRDTVYRQLLVDAMDWCFRVHATFRFDDVDAPSHIYLGENWTYKPERIPSSIRDDIELRMSNLLRDFEASAKVEIAKRIK